MNLIDNITDQANQLTNVVLTDGTVLQLTLVYRAATERWTMDINHPLLIVTGINLCVHPNILREWRNLITFGLAIVSTDGADPISIEDFTSGRITLYVLTADEINDVEINVFGGALQ